MILGYRPPARLKLILIVTMSASAAKQQSPSAMEAVFTTNTQPDAQKRWKDAYIPLSL
jgi:hypothetical protein